MNSTDGLVPRKYRIKTPRQRAKEQCLLLAKAHVYARDNYTCQRCSRQVYAKNCHASHIIPVSADGRLAVDYRNMKVLCYGDHLWWHENPCESGMWYRTTYPAMWRWLHLKKIENAAKGPIKLDWFQEWIDWYEGQNVTDERTDDST